MKNSNFLSFRIRRWKIGQKVKNLECKLKIYHLCKLVLKYFEKANKHVGISKA